MNYRDWPLSVDNHDVAQLENFRLKVFRAVAEQVSFHKAAKQLFLTQPAVTLQIKTLEDELGIRLFDRAGGHVSLTRQGALLLPSAEELAALATETREELAAAEGQLAGNLEIRGSTTTAQYVLPQ